jgi:probable HAF family extracellular repeat protein
MPRDTPAKAVGGINSDGWFAGTMYGPDNPDFFRAFLFDGRAVLDLGLLPGGNTCIAASINNSGQICGYSHNGSTGFNQAFLWQGGSMVGLEFPYGEKSAANDIANNGSICGWMGDSPPAWHAFLHTRDGVVIDLGPIPGGTSSVGLGVNEIGEVCGYGVLPLPDGKGETAHAFYWSNGTMIDLGVLPGQVISRALSINDNSDIVGYCEHTDGETQPKAFIWRDGLMTALNDLIPAELELDIHYARGINNNGQIVGTALDKENRWSAVILTPIPSPIGDFNCDATVNVDDLLGVINNWAKTPPQGSKWLPPGDFDHDGLVELDDLMIVIDNWGL